MQIIDNINIKTIECKILNGRKVNIKIILDENIKLYSNEDIEIVNEIDDIKNLEKPHQDNSSKVSSSIVTTSSYTSISKSKTAKSEVNVIGLNVEEAVFVVDKFLDDASLAKLQTVRIVHGKGTGKLKNSIHKFLKTNPHVKSFRIGTYGEGEMGVTVVELK